MRRELDKYTKLNRFITVESELKNFVTKTMNLIDKSENQKTFDRIFGLLENEYYKGPVVDDKIRELHDMVVDDYFLLEDAKEDKLKTQGILRDMHETTS